MIYICIHVCQAVVYHGDREKNCAREIGEQRQLTVINIITVIITIWLMNHHYNVGAIVTIWMTIILPYSRAVKWTQQLSGNIYIYFIFYALMYFCCIPISIIFVRISGTPPPGIKKRSGIYLSLLAYASFARLTSPSSSVSLTVAREDFQNRPQTI